MKYSLSIALLIAVLFISCKKDVKTEPVTPTGSLALFFENKVDTASLVLNTKKYVNQNGDTFTVSKYKYYISNIILTNTDGKKYYEPESYHLIDQSNAGSLVFVMHGVPTGHYNSMSFIIGVDSLRNCSGAQTGDLDPVKGMFWDWTSGYIMAWLEGTSPKSTATNNGIVYQTVGFTGQYNVIKTISPSFGNMTAEVENNDHFPEIHISSDVAEWLKTPSVINFATLPVVGAPGAASREIADNYADMFKIAKVIN